MMKKFLLLMTVFLMAIGVNGIANADLIDDITGYVQGCTDCGGEIFVDVDTSSSLLDSSGDSISYSFDLDDDFLAVGDVNSEDDIISAYLGIGIWDTDLDEDFYIGRILISRGETETGDITIDSTLIWDDTELDIALYTFDVLADVVDDHLLTVVVSWASGDFRVTGAGVGGCYTDNEPNAPVPEPATMLLLGTGLVGLAAGSRKKFLKK